MNPAIKPHTFLHEPQRPIKLENPCIVQVVTPAQRCPKCNKPGHWRMGQEFDHEMRCGDCSSMEGSVIWEPGKTYLMIEVLERKIPTESTGLASTGDVTSRDMDILGHFGMTAEENLPEVETEPEGVTITLCAMEEGPAVSRKEIQKKDAALARSGLSKKALELVALARAEGVDRLKLNSAYDPVSGTTDPSWT